MAKTGHFRCCGVAGMRQCTGKGLLWALAAFLLQSHMRTRVSPSKRL